MTVSILSPPSGEVISLADAKAFLQVGHDGEDALISSLLQAATDRVESLSGLALLNRTLRLQLAAYPRLFHSRGVRLRPAPVGRLASVQIIDGATLVADITSDFRFFAGVVCPNSIAALPTLSATHQIAFNFETGFGTASDIPDDLKWAVKLVLSSAYSARDARAAEPPLTAMSIVNAYREVRL